ncbi:MAG: zinc ribbon domain-containing protein [Dehalococcoidales bacterium]|nr:zinc ribbon domain-containing protein [Dehalococcoidales bacterium]
MPIYEYLCSCCNSKFELLRPLSQSEEDADCPHCHKSAERVLSTFACFTTGDGGIPASLGGGSACGSCGAASCDTCHI